MDIKLGIDTGGTYTDAVIYDSSSKKVLSYSKSPTIKQNLKQGILNAIDLLDSDLFTKITGVYLSTTLATNACVEHKYYKAKLVMINSYKRVVDEEGEKYGLNNEDEIIFTDLDDEKIKDREYIEKLKNTILKNIDDCDGISIVQRNDQDFSAKYEKFLQALLSKETDKPIICGYQLFNDLNCIRRGASTVLNVKLIPIIENFIVAIKAALKERVIDAPVNIVRSDGSLMSDLYSSQRPVETILCGPAASLMGARSITEEKNSIIVDMGGTTTDISMVKNENTIKVSNGVNIGKWKTMVKGVFIETFALGGDSRLLVGNKNFVINDKRAIPFCTAVSKYPTIMVDLKAMIKKYKKHSLPIYEFFILEKDPDNITTLTEAQKRLCQALKVKPLIYTDVCKYMGSDIYTLDISELENKGIVQRIGLTPTDIMHIKGDFNAFDKEASVFLAEYFINSVNYYSGFEYTLESFVDAVYDKISKKLYRHIVKILIENDNDKYDSTIDSLAKKAWIKAAKPEKSFFNPIFTTNAVLTGIGAPIHLFLPKVAKAMQTKCIIPEHSEVANAIGAASGKVEVYSKTEIIPVYDPESNTDVVKDEDDQGNGNVYKVLCTENVKASLDRESAIKMALEDAEQKGILEFIARGGNKNNMLIDSYINKHADEITEEKVELGITVIVKISSK